MSHSLLSFKIKSTDYACPFNIDVKINNEHVYKVEHLSQPVIFQHPFDDDVDAEYEIEIIISGKLPGFTKIDEQGNILSDALLEFSDFYFDDICIDKLINKIVEYHHDYNSTGKPTVDKFYNQAGCNGSLKFKVSTPVYMWLLEQL